jgi:uncharacterized membrane protein
MKGVAEYITSMTPAEARRELLESESPDMRRRRWIIGLSMLGLGVAAIASLKQTGILGKLPDPPIEGFDADKVMISDEAYQFGIPDAAIALTGLAANVPIAAWGGADRASEQPIVPLIAAGKAAIEIAAAGWYFYQMPAKLKTWCAYCIVSAGAYAAIFILTLPEAQKALSELMRSK